MLNIHQSIKEKLQYFYDNHKIPNIIFNGQSGSGKSTLVNEFISMIYGNDKDKIKDYVMYVNCAHGKGIKFIREELKFFAKTHIHSNGGNIFKSIILLNGDKLTMDAQSALRRCIELFSHTTRFFIIVEDKYKLLRPILSRFCEIYVPEPELRGKPINLYKYNLEQTFQLTEFDTVRLDWLKKELQKIDATNMCHNDLMLLTDRLYERAYNILDIMKLIEDEIIPIESERRYELLVAFSKVRKEIRNEKMLLMFAIHFTFIDTNANLENMSFL